MTITNRTLQPLFMPTEHAGMNIRLLGPLQAWQDDTELVLGSGNRTAVLSFLALHANHAVTREQLIAALWGDDPPASATGNLYTYISSLRKILDPCRHQWSAGQVLTSGGGTYRLRVRKQDVDAFRFEALREESKRHRTIGDSRTELASLAAALRMWQGTALAGVPGPFAEAQRQRLAELRLTTAERHATLLVETGCHDEAISTLRTLIEAHPTRENLAPLLTAALHAAGRADVPRRPRPPIPTEPAGHVPASPPRTGTRSPVRAGPGSLAGRETEIRRLRRAVVEATRGQGRSIRVEGFTGMGKSALLAVALPSTAPSTCRIGWAVGRELSQRVPLGLLLECMESALAGEPGSELVRQVSLATNPPMGDSAPAPVARVVSLVRQVAQQAPLVLVVDNLHWADPHTVAAWTALHEVTTQLPLLLIATSWPGAAKLGAAADEVHELAPLNRTASSHLVRTAAPEPPDSPELDRLVAAAGGNPCYLWHLATAGSDPNAQLPANLIGVVHAHLAPFTQPTREVLRAAAFLAAGPSADVGPGCSLSELAMVTERPTAELAELLTPAARAGVVASTGDRLTFRHPVVTRVLHEGTASALRVLLHRSFAERIAGAGGPPERVVTQLLADAVPLDVPLTRWLTTHVEQLTTRAPRITVTILQRAHAQCTMPPADRMTITIWLARLLLRLGRNCAAEAGWVASRTDDLDVEGEMRWMVALTYEKRGEHQTAADIARSVLHDRRVPAPWLHRFRLMQARLRRHLADRHDDWHPELGAGP